MPDTAWVAWLGIGLGLLGLWLALPPLAARSIAATAACVSVGAAAGVWTVVHGAKRPGLAAIVACAAALGGALLAQRSSVANLDLVFVWGSLIAATLRFATPLVFAAIGGMFSERSGVSNIGLEGMMLMGAFWAIWGTLSLGHWWAGLATAALAGGALALVHAFWSIHLRADQIISGTAVNALGYGITGYAFLIVYGAKGTPSLSSPESVPDLNLGFLDHLPVAGHFIYAAVGQLNLMIWLAGALLLIASLVMFRTTLGLRLRAVGEHPRAAETAGLSVYRTRYAAVTASGMLAALGGAYLSIGFVHSFNQDMVAGRGFIALAALIFGKWRPAGACVAALLFGLSTALAYRLPVYSNSGAILFQALPYLLTLIAVTGVVGRSTAPAAIGRPYLKQ